MNYDAVYANYLVLLVNIPVQAEFLLHSPDRAAGSTDFDVNSDKTKITYFSQDGAIFLSNNKSLKIVDQFIYTQLEKAISIDT